MYLPGGLEPDSDDEEAEEEAPAATSRPASAVAKSNGDVLIAQSDLVITGSADATAKIWSLYSGECLFVRSKIKFITVNL